MPGFSAYRKPTHGPRWVTVCPRNRSDCRIRHYIVSLFPIPLLILLQLVSSRCQEGKTKLLTIWPNFSSWHPCSLSKLRLQHLISPRSIRHAAYWVQNFLPVRSEFILFLCTSCLLRFISEPRLGRYQGGQTKRIYILFVISKEMAYLLYPKYFRILDESILQFHSTFSVIQITVSPLAMLNAAPISVKRTSVSNTTWRALPFR